MYNYYKQEKKFISINNKKVNNLKNFVKKVLYWVMNFLYWSVFLIDKIFRKCGRNEKKYYVSICAIFKDEKKNLEEWIRFNIACGVDHIYMYDNNSSDDYLDILSEYIESGYVDLIRWPENHSQMKAYHHCFESRKNESKWIGFIDIDEFICPVTEYTLKKWLIKYENFPNIAVYWKQFGSNGRIANDEKKYVIEQYTQCWSKPSTFTKIFFNTDYKISSFDNPHIASNKILYFNFPTVNQFGKLIIFGIHRANHSGNIEVQLNHYWGQAYDVFIERKINKTDVFHADNINMANLRMRILKEHELLCTAKDFTIQKYLLQMKVAKKYGYAE